MQAGSRVEIFIDLPLEVTGLVVGKKGATINKIKFSSKANVALASEPLPQNQKYKRLTIQGTKFEVENARDQIVRLLCGWCGIGSEAGGENQNNIDLLPVETRSIVLAYKGSRNQNGHGAPSHATKPFIKTAENSNIPTGAQQGASANMSPSRAPMQPKVQEMPRHEENRNGAAGHMYPGAGAGMMNGQLDRPSLAPEVQLRPPDVQLRAEVEVPRACIRYIVGQNYENIANLERTSRAQIFPVDTADVNSPMIRIAFVGDEQAIFLARALLMQAVNNWTTRVQHCMQAFQQPTAPNNPPSLQPTMQSHPTLHLGQPQMPMGMNVDMLSQPAHLQSQSIPSIGSPPGQRPVMTPAAMEPREAHQQSQPMQKQPVQQGPVSELITEQSHVRPAANARVEKSVAAAPAQGSEKGVSRLEVKIPTAAAGMIVGKKGVQIKRFKQECNVRVIINKEEDTEESTTKVVMLEGSGPALDKGLLMMCETLAQWAENSNQDALHRQADFWMKELKSQEQPSANVNSAIQSANQAKAAARPKKSSPDDRDDSYVRVEMKVPLEAVALIVGKQGKTINMFKKDIGCNIAFAHDSEVPDPPRKTLVVQGTVQQCNQAKAKILDFLAYSKMTMETATGKDEADVRALYQSRLAWLHEHIEEHVVSIVRPSEAQRQAHAHHVYEAQAGNNRAQPSATPVQMQSVAPGRIEMHITRASAAMIIGKKGTMHKQLQGKTGATITLEQEALADGRKRLVIEGSEDQVQKAKHLVDDILRQCDDNKYEETERKKQAEEEEKRRSEETIRKTKKEEVTRRQVQEQAHRDAVEKEVNRKQEEERRWKEKQEKAARDAEKKRLFAEKVASNPFAFLDEEEGAEEEAEESQQASPASTREPNASKKKKKRGGKPAEGTAPAAAEPAANQSPHPPPHTEPLEKADHVRAAAAADKDKEAEEEAEDEDDDDESDSGAEESGTTGMGGEKDGCVTLRVASLSRRGTEHANEDRLLSCDLTDALSEDLKAALLERSVSKKMPVFAVFDGHGGPGAAEYCKQNLLHCLVQELEQCGLQGGSAIDEALTKGFEQLEEDFRSHCKEKGDKSGTCAVCVVVVEEEGVYTLHTANVGDCRAMIGRRDETGKVTAVKLTEDHRAIYAQERKRIETAGGKIEEKRALGDLIPSRTIGDFKTKGKCPGAVIATPQIASVELTPADKFVILASDGLWDDLKVMQVMDILDKEKEPDAANKALYAAVTRKCGTGKSKSKDDITIISVYL